MCCSSSARIVWYLADDLLVGVVDLFDVVAVGEEVVEGVGGHRARRQHAGTAIFVAVGHAAGQDALLVLELGLLFVVLLRLRLVELGLDLFDLGDRAVLLMAEGLEVGSELIELGLDGGKFSSAVARASMVACVARAACARAGKPEKHG